MPSRKAVFYSPPDSEANHLLKRLFQDKYGMALREDKDLDLVFDYIKHKVNGTSMDLKLYLVSDLEKHKRLCPLYFTDVGIFFVVFDVGKENVVTWEKIYEDLKLHQSNSQMYVLGYRKNGNIHDESVDFLSSHGAVFLEFSEQSGLEDIIESLLVKFAELEEKTQTN